MPMIPSWICARKAILVIMHPMPINQPIMAITTARTIHIANMTISLIFSMTSLLVVSNSMAKAKTVMNYTISKQ